MQGFKTSKIRLPFKQITTIYNRYGDCFIILCALFLLLIPLIEFIRKVLIIKLQEIKKEPDHQEASG